MGLSGTRSGYLLGVDSVIAVRVYKGCFIFSLRVRKLVLMRHPTVYIITWSCKYTCVGVKLCTYVSDHSAIFSRISHFSFSA